MLLRILFGSIAALVLIAISYFTAKTYAAGFRFNGIATRTSFLVFLLIPLTFVASMLTIRSASWGAGPLVYTIIQIIAGIGFYLFIGAIALAIVLGVAALLHISIPISIAIGIGSIAIVVALIGLVQSRMVTVRDYTITLAGAPLSWNDKTAVLVTDTHFGLVNYTSFSEKVVDHILALNPDFVIHAGDFYDGPAVATEPITKSWKRLTAKAPLFYAPGNHEGYGDYKAFVESVHASGATVLDDKKVLYDGVTIAGITYRQGKESPEATKAIDELGLADGTPTILINHPPTSLAAAQAAGVALMVSGHTHNGQMWPMTYIIRRMYGAYYHGLADYAGMKVITSSGIGTFGPPLRLFNPPELVRIHFTTQ